MRTETGGAGESTVVRDRMTPNPETLDADPGRIKAESRLCVLLYQPVTASVTGTWHGREVRWTHRFGNTCEMRRATGVLFQF